MTRRNSTRRVWSNPVNPERLLILAFCLAAVVRVSIFAAAFPFFTNLDEQRHIDLVLKFSRGYWPTEPEEHFDLASGRLFSLYGTWEYLNRPEQVPGYRLIPLCIFPPEKTEHLLSGLAAIWSNGDNFEAHSPPVYYAVAGLFYRVAGFLGFKGIEQLYLLRLMNGLLAGLLVLAAYLLCTQEFPAQVLMRLGVPLLAAFVPSDVFSSVNSDVLSPLLFTLSLWVGLRWFRSVNPSVGLGVLLGLLISATFLVKLTNIALPIVFLLACAWRATIALRDRTLPSAWKTISIPAAIAALPLLLWMIRNYAFFGDLTGNGTKLRILEWSWKPAAEMLHHPLFTAKGLWTFWSNLMSTLWRGELFWHGVPLQSPGADWFYSLSSTVLVLAALGYALRHCIFGHECVRSPLHQMDLGSVESPAGPCRAETQAAMILSVLVSVMCLMWTLSGLRFR